MNFLLFFYFVSKKSDIEKVNSHKINVDMGKKKNKNKTVSPKHAQAPIVNLYTEVITKK